MRGNGPDRGAGGRLRRVSVTARQQLRLTMRSVPVNGTDRVEDIMRRESTRARRAMVGSVDASADLQFGIGRVHDSIHVDGRDVTEHQAQRLSLRELVFHAEYAKRSNPHLAAIVKDG